MLQPIQGPRSNSKLPSAMQAFATGAAGAANDVARSYLNNKMQEMYEDKKTQKALDVNAKINKSIFGNEYGGADPTQAMAYHKFQTEHGGQQRINSFRDLLVNGDENGSVGQASGSPTTRTKEMFNEASQGGYQNRSPVPQTMLPTGQIPQNNQLQQPQAQPPQLIPQREIGSTQPPPQVEGPIPKKLSIKDVDNLSKPTKPLNPIEQMRQNRQRAVEAYNKERDPLVKEQMYKDIRAVSDDIRREREVTSRESKDFMAREKHDKEMQSETKEYLGQLQKAHQTLESKNVNLKAIEDLSTTGSPTKWLKQISNWMGIDENLLLGADSETINKLSNDLVPGIVQTYEGAAGRILKSEADSFVKSIPSLYQTESGRKTVARYVRKSNELKENEYQSSRALAKQYRSEGKRLPELQDFQDEVLEHGQDRRREILQEMHKIATESLPVQKVDSLEDGSFYREGTEADMPDGSIQIVRNGKWEKK